MKIVGFGYQLQLSFSDYVKKHYFTLKGFPVSDERQLILEVEQTITPYEELAYGTDSFGNRYAYGRAEEAHQVFSVEIKGRAEVGRSVYTKAEQVHQVGVFRAPTSLTCMGQAMEALYQVLPTYPRGYEWMNQAGFGEIEPGSNLWQAFLIMKAVGEHMVYTPGATNLKTTAEEALAKRMGVCQDYAHIMLGLCRRAGIPCRYVVGLLIGEGASHAWVEVYQDGKWYGFDPTNQVTVIEDHVKFSHGRDYCDCLLNRGKMCGLAWQSQQVSVRVEELMDKAPDEQQ